jgi:RNA polymerase sigma factor (sigma-70 family)
MDCEGFDLGLEAGQNALVSMIHSLAHRAAKRQAPRRSDAPDAAQDVVLHCLRRIREGTWQGVRLVGGNLESHISCLVKRRLAVLKRQRRRGMERDMEYLRDLDAGVRTWMEPEAAIDDVELSALREATLKKLSTRCRAAFELVRNERLSYEMAAERLGVTPSTVKAHVIRAQGAFRAVLRERGVVVPKEKAPKTTAKGASGTRKRRQRAAIAA